MIKYTTGDLLKSDAQALVNTVNCEGYMGKGIAYQFKLVYPENNLDYVRVCKNGTLKIGKLHYFNEKGKTIINFPTKNKWRAKSKMEYIEVGMDELIKLIKLLDIKSIAIPPLGSGNGGLIWSEVKAVIESKLSVLSSDIDVYIYEPSTNYVAKSTVEPKLSLSALVLMKIKSNLNKFDTLRLQKTAYFIDVFSGQNYFNFKKHKYGPYDNAISIISRNIKEYQQYHNVKDSEEAYKILHNKIVSENIENKLNELLPFIVKASKYVNSIPTNHELECISTVVYLIDKNNVLSEEDILEMFNGWSEDKAKRFSDREILECITKLYKTGVIEKTLTGYAIHQL